TAPEPPLNGTASEPLLIGAELEGSSNASVPEWLFNTSKLKQRPNGAKLSAVIGSNGSHFPVSDLILITF
ncbi:MAG: hypothetical protein EBV72_08085, partial [Betaproteobacteria bacterium]|nr:hypothetical protein [Betaproteobacteria bacterium]